MGRNRLEAFSDGVLAIIITIMVFGLKVPQTTSLESLAPVIPMAVSYALSFLYVGIYWNNHHHLVHAVKTVNGKILWANLHLLFWLSLFPFVTNWMGENFNASIPSALYGAVLFAAAVAYRILQHQIVKSGDNDQLRNALGKDWKGIVSPCLYGASSLIALWKPLAAQALFVVVALLWLIPDRRIERALRMAHNENKHSE